MPITFNPAALTLSDIIFLILTFYNIENYTVYVFNYNSSIKMYFFLKITSVLSLSTFCNINFLFVVI